MKKNLSNNYGVSSILTAILFPVFMGSIALSVDMSYSRLDSSRIKSITDVVAQSLQKDLAQNCGSSSCSLAYLQSEANTESSRLGCTSSGLMKCDIGVQWPYNNVDTQIQLSISRDHLPTVAHFIGGQTFRASSRKVVDSQDSINTGDTFNGDGCILALEPYYTGILIQNGSQGNLAGSLNPACGVYSNSTGYYSMELMNNATIAGEAVTPGWIALLNNNPPYQISSVGSKKDYTNGGQAINNPYSSIQITHNNNGPCMEQSNNGQQYNWNNGSITLSPGHWCSGWNGNNVQINLNPGTYYVDNQMNFSNVNLTSNGNPVTIVTGSNSVWGFGFSINLNNTNINLTSGGNSDTNIIPGLVWTTYTDGYWSNLLNSLQYTMYLNSGDSFVFSGAIYMPNAGLYVRNGSKLESTDGQDGCGQVVVRNFSTESSVLLGNNCSTEDDGVLPFGNK